VKQMYDLWYRHDTPPWVGGPRHELVRLVTDGILTPGSAIDLGCAVGDNAIFPAQHRFTVTVTGVDFARAAIERARATARDAGVAVCLISDDLTHLRQVSGPFDRLVDYGTLDALGSRGREAYCVRLWRWPCWELGSFCGASSGHSHPGNAPPLRSSRSAGSRSPRRGRGPLRVPVRDQLDRRRTTPAGLASRMGRLPHDQAQRMSRPPGHTRCHRQSRMLSPRTVRKPTTMVQSAPRKRPELATPPADVRQVGPSDLGHGLAWSALKRARSSRYPRPLQDYPLGVFHHPGILHRNNRTKSRAIASDLVARLKRRDRSCIGDDLGPESLGDGVSGPASARASARSPKGSWSTSQHQPSSVARDDFQRPEVALGQRPNLAGYVLGYGQK